MAVGFIAAIFANCAISYIVCPLIVLKKEEVNTTISEYYKSYNKKDRGYYVRFHNDTEDYCVGLILFQKFRKRVGASVSYIKYQCPFETYFIRKIKIDTTYIGRASSWETSRYTKTQEKLFFFALIFAIVSIMLFLVVFGIAGVLPWQY